MEAFIFDVDGTLIDTKELHTDSWISAFADFGIRVSRNEIQLQLGKQAPEIVKSIINDTPGCDAGVIAERKGQYYSQLRDRVTAFPHVRELMQALHDRGLRIALGTSAKAADAEYYVELMSIADIIDAVVAAEDSERSKPDPEVFLVAAQRLNADPAACVVVGDTIHDITAAKNTGMQAYGVLTGGNSRKELEDAGADNVFIDIADIYLHLDEIL